MTREHFSHSALRQLMTCPRQYHLQRVDRVEPTHRSPSLVLGSVYHQVLANALLSLKEGEPVTREALRLWFDDLWAAELKLEPPIKWTDRTTEESERALGRAMVEAWFEQGYRVFQEGLAILAVELPFRVPIVSAKNDVLETPLEGVIDAVYLTLAEEVVIVDHKTAAQGFGQTFIDMDLQATAYAHAVRYMGWDDGATFRYHVMSKAKKGPKLEIVEVPRTEDDFDRLYWVAEQAERLIASGVFLPSAPGWQCDACEYRKACQRAHAGADETVILPAAAAV